MKAVDRSLRSASRDHVEGAHPLGQGVAERQRAAVAADRLGTHPLQDQAWVCAVGQAHPERVGQDQVVVAVLPAELGASRRLG